MCTYIVLWTKFREGKLHIIFKPYWLFFFSLNHWNRKRYVLRHDIIFEVLNSYNRVSCLNQKYNNREKRKNLNIEFIKINSQTYIYTGYIYSSIFIFFFLNRLKKSLKILHITKTLPYYNKKIQKAHFIRLYPARSTVSMSLMVFFPNTFFFIWIDFCFIAFCNAFFLLRHSWV